MTTPPAQNSRDRAPAVHLPADQRHLCIGWEDDTYALRWEQIVVRR